MFWQPSLIDGGSPITSYKVTLYEGGSPAIPIVVPAEEAGYVYVSGLTNGTPYTATVRATNALGDSPESAPSAAVTPRPTPPETTATAVTAVADGAGGQATVSWSAPSNDGGSPITAYTVVSSPDAKACSTTGATSCTVRGLVNGVSYTFTVTAANAVGPGQASGPSQAVLPRAVTAVAFRSAARGVVFGSAVGIAGTVTVGGTPRADVQVSLEYRRRGGNGSFTSLPSAMSDYAGVVTFRKFVAPYSAQLRLVALSTGAYFGSVSAPTSLTVSRALSISSSRTSVRKGKSFALSGKVSPSGNGMRVGLERKSGSTWLKLRSETINSSGRYAFAVAASKLGSVTYRIAVAADADFAASASVSKTVRIV